MKVDLKTCGLSCWVERGLGHTCVLDVLSGDGDWFWFLAVKVYGL